MKEYLSLTNTTPSGDLSDEEVFSASIKTPSLFQVIVKRYEASFIRVAEKILKERAEAEDAAQEAFLKIYLKASSFTPTRVGSFKSWAYTVLVNTALSMYRKKKRGHTVELSEELAAIIPDDTPIEERRETADYVASVLKRIPDHFAETITKFFIEGKTHEEIAREEGVTEGSVKVRLHRAKQAFREADIKLANQNE